MPDKTEGFAVRRRIQRNIWIAATIIGLLATVLVGAVRIHTLKREKETVQTRLENEVQQGIAKEIFRLHVVANSDTEEDQNLKLHVKTKIVDYLEGILGEDRSLEATREAVKTHLDEIEEAAGEVIADEGNDYPVAAAVEKTYFPDKTYGDCTFPAGEYEALNVKIGKAEGHNWWCVLYPSLCFLDESHGIVSEEKKEDLREVLTEEEFLTILNDPEKRDQVLKLMDYIASGEGLDLVCYGVEGVHYKKEGDQITALPAMSDITWSYNYQLVGRDDVPYYGVKYPTLTEYRDFAYGLDRINVYTNLIQIPDKFNIVDLRSYEQQELVNFIYGKRDMDEFDDFLKTLEDTYHLSTYKAAAESTLKECGYIK